MSDGFNIGPVYVYYYGIIIMLGALTALWLSIREAKYRGLDSEVVWDVVPWLLIAGIIGARLWHVLTPSKSMGAGVEVCTGAAQAEMVIKITRDSSVYFVNVELFIYKPLYE